jgi:hypothetical protein
MKTAKTTTKAAPVPLRTAQVRIIAAMAKAPEPMTRKEIAEAAECDLAGLTEWVGSSDPKKRAANDKRWFPSLLSSKLVTAKDADGTTVYTITAKGRKVAEKAAAK